jgi:hypothetical protein
VLHPLRRFWRLFAVDEESWVPHPHCPICDREVVGYAGATVRGDGGLTGYRPTEREVLIEHCPVPGHQHHKNKKHQKGRERTDE